MHIKIISFFSATTILYLIHRYFVRELTGMPMNWIINVFIFCIVFNFAGKMASKDKLNKSDDGEQPQQPVVDRDKVKQEREARRLAKVAAKQKVQDKSRSLPNSDEKMPETKTESPSKIERKKSPKKETSTSVDKNVHRKAEKHGKGDVKNEVTNALANDLDKLKIQDNQNEPSQSSSGDPAEKIEKKQLSKAERRAIQEAQRAAKAAKTAEKSAPKPSKESPATASKESTGAKPKQQNTPSTSKESGTRKATPVKKPQQHRVKLFSHLYTDTQPANVLNSSTIHPEIVRLGVQYSSGVVKGCNARGLAFMSAIKSVIAEYDTPSQKEFSRGLEDVLKTCGIYLQQCRPLAVSVTNAMKFIQFQLNAMKVNQLQPGQVKELKSDAEVSCINCNTKSKSF